MALVVKKGSKMRFRFSGGMPQPLSPMAIQIQSPSPPVRMVMVPCSAMAWLALSSKFMNT